MRIITCATLLLVPRLAAADVPQCASVDTDLSFQATDISPWNGDTGWVPSNSDAQVRLVAQVDGQTTVAMGLSPTLCWNNGSLATIAGQKGAGMLSFAYGAELQLFGQIHTSVIGYSVDWEGQIPIPYIPTDLLLANTATFDTPGFTAAIGASDTTSPVHVLQTDELGDLLGITGISGGLHVDVIGGMTTSFKPTSITTPAGAITTDDGDVAVTRPTGGFAGGLDFDISASGVVTYAPMLTFNVGFNVKLVGITVVNVTLVSVPMQLPPIDRPISLTGAATRIPLASVAAGTRLDFSTGATQSLHLENHGEAPLIVEVASAPNGVTAQPITIAPGAQADLAVTTTVTDGLSGTLALTTNDPDQPSLAIAVGVDIGGTDNTPVTPEHTGGCNAGGGNAGGLLALAVMGLIAVPRRRRAAR